MNIHLMLTDAIRRFAARRQSLHAVEKRTYVFILVPFDLRGNGHVKRADIREDLVDNGRHPERARTQSLFSTLAAIDRPASGAIAKRDLNSDPELNHDLMWTWFLPNPLWPPKRSDGKWFFREQAAENST